MSAMVIILGIAASSSGSHHSEPKHVDIFALSKVVIENKVGNMSYREAYYVWKDNKKYCIIIR